MVLGAHVSIKGGLLRCVEHASNLGVEALQLSTRHSKRWFTGPLDPDDLRTFRFKSTAFDSGHMFSLCSPLINLSASDDEIYARSIDAMYDELIRAEALGMSWVVTRLGNHDGRGEEWALRRAISAINDCLTRTASFGVGVLLESSAGEHNSVGHTLEHLARVRSRIIAQNRIGVCVDTNSIFGAGYDLRDLKAYMLTIAQLQRIVGLKNVQAFHLADSSLPLGNRRGGATGIGEGAIGTDAFSYLVNDPRLKDVPMLLEIPGSNVAANDARNLELLTSLVGTVKIEP